MPPVGGRRQENWCQADFHRPRHEAKFDNNVWDGEYQRDIDFSLILQKQIVLHIVIDHNCGPAVQFGG